MAASESPKKIVSTSIKVCFPAPNIAASFVEKVSPSNPLAFPSEKKAQSDPSNETEKFKKTKPDDLENAGRVSFLHLR